MIVAVAVLFISIGALPAGGPADNTSQETRNKAVVMRLYDEIFNQGRFEVANEIYAPDFRHRGLHGEATLKEDQDAAREEKTAFPDLRMTVNKQVAEGDYVTTMWTFQGTHTAWGYAGLPPTGARLEMRGMTIMRVVDGRILEEWTEFDEGGAYLQILGQVKGALLIVLLLFVALVIAVERGLVWAVRAGLRGRSAKGTGGST
jgi:steroid delta-isomerase-like uncharacterized protein